MNIDYSVCKALQYNTKGMKQGLLFYDIFCQWIIHFMERLDEGEYLSLPENMKLLGGVGKFHLNAHKDECFLLFSPNFIEGAGLIDGEKMEPLWVDINKVSKFTKYMTKASRRQVMDDQMRDFNFKKMIGMGRLFLKCLIPL